MPVKNHFPDKDNGFIFSTHRGVVVSAALFYAQYEGSKKQLKRLLACRRISLVFVINNA